MLPAGTFYGPDVHLQGLPLLASPGPGDNCEEGGPYRHARGESQGEEKMMFTAQFVNTLLHYINNILIIFIIIQLTFIHLSYQGEVLFSSWMAIFSGNGGIFNPSIPIYSFDGRNVMTDSAW